MEELLGLASPRSMRDRGGHMAPVDAEWPGPPAQATVVDTVWNQKPEAPIWWPATTLDAGDTGQATHLWAFSFPTCSMGTKPHLTYPPMGCCEAQAMGKYSRSRKMLDSLSYCPYPVHSCAQILNR